MVKVYLFILSSYLSYYQRKKKLAAIESRVNRLQKFILFNGSKKRGIYVRNDFSYM